MQERVDQFLRYLKNEQGYSDNTIAAYRNDLNQFVAFLRRKFDPGIESWSDMDEQVILEYGTHLQNQSYASSTIARKVASVKSFFSFLIGQEVLANDPTRVLDVPKVEKHLPRILSIEEVEALLSEPAKVATPKALRDQALLNLLYATGIRVSEAVTLKLRDVDLKKASIVCGGQEGKARELPLPPRTLETLKTYLEKGRTALLRDPEEKTLFLNHRGRPLTRQGLWLIIKSYAEAASVGRDVTPQTLRHSFAAHRLERGSDLKQVRDLLGHANISTTRTYEQVIGQADEESEADRT